MSELCAPSVSRRPTLVIMRHGFSLANAQRVIVSTLENGLLDAYGLHESGRTQVAESAAQLAQHLTRGYEAAIVRIVTSPFSRTRETSAILADVLRGANLFSDVQVTEDERLRERSFGELELTSDDGYHRVWEQDATTGDSNTSLGCEAPAAVWQRVDGLLAEQLAATAAADGQVVIIILVSHGDTLQITQTGLAGLPVHRHRTAVRHMNQGEWRIVSQL